MSRWISAMISGMCRCAGIVRGALMFRRSDRCEGLHVRSETLAKNPFLVRPVDDPVVDVGEVGDVGDLEPLGLEVARITSPATR